MSGEENCKKLLEEGKTNVTRLNQKVLDILKEGKQVSISNSEYMKCYDAVIKACDAQINPVGVGLGKASAPVQRNEQALFNWFVELINEYLSKDLAALDQIQDKDQYVAKVLEQYTSYQIYLYWQSRMFYYLNSFFLKNQNSTIVNEGFKLYRDKYFVIISDKLFMHITYFQKLARDDQVIPKEIIKKLIHIYLEVGFKKGAELKKDPNSSGYNYSFEPGFKYYEDHFQCKFALEMEQYYQQKVSEWSNLSTPEYVEVASRYLTKEEEIAEIYYPKSAKIILNRIEQIIIQLQSETLVNNEMSGLSRMLTEKKEKEMKNLYTLFNRVKETLDQIAKKVNQYIIYHGNELNMISDSRKNENVALKDIAVEYIQKASTLKKESDHMMLNIFGQDITIEKARDSAFQSFLNKNEKSTFFLATYADLILRQENLSNDSEIDQHVHEIVGLFNFFYSRDTFFKHYQKYFSNRLLNSTSKNKEAEKSLIAKFKAEAGQTGVNKIETMLKDITNSEQFILENKEKLQKNSTIELSVNVLTTGSWPIANLNDKCNPPLSLKNIFTTFESLYKEKYRGRNINWLFSQGTAEVTFRSKERYILILSSYQMIALLLIQSQGSSISYSQLLELSGVPDSELGFNLMPLIKLKVLNKSDSGENIADDSIITVNDTFSNKMKRIRCIPGGKQGQQKKQKEDEEGKQQFMEEMTREREFIIDACVVRVMKSRKQMKHNELFQEVLKLINNFKPEISVIKKRIESLLERDYLKRDETDRNTFIYVP